MNDRMNQVKKEGEKRGKKEGRDGREELLVEVTPLFPGPRSLK